MILPPLPAGLDWNTNSININGALAVAVANRPVIGSISISGTGFTLSGTGGVGNASFVLLGATNISTPPTNWTRLVTNQFDASGNFNFTNAVNPNSPLSFYLLQLQ